MVVQHERTEVGGQLRALPRALALPRCLLLGFWRCPDRIAAVGGCRVSFADDLYPSGTALEGTAFAALQFLTLARLNQRVRAASRASRLSDATTSAYWRTVAASPALRARTRELRDELENGLTQLLQDSLGGREPSARLIASMLVAA